MDDESKQDIALLRKLAEELGVESEKLDDMAMTVAISMYEEFRKTGDEGYINAAVHFARLTLCYPCNEPASRTARLNNLGVMLESRYERMGEMSDLEEAIKTARQAVDSTPVGHPDRAACLNNLGNNLGHL
jgi:hypothetical protein